MNKQFLRCLLALALVGANVNLCLGAGRTIGALTDFGDPQAVNLAAIAKPQGLNFRWAQFGDSHTAGEYFTGELRRQLQARLGDAGPGWLFPGYVRQQRFEVAKLSNTKGWDIQVSRSNSDFAGVIGGVQASASMPEAGFSFNFKDPLPQGNYLLKTLLQPLSSTELLSVDILNVRMAGKDLPLLVDPQALPMSWQVMANQLSDPAQELQLTMPYAQSAKLAGIWIDKVDVGATLDALGINGAKAETVAKWDSASVAAWLHERQPTVVALAYGTNEALDPQFSALRFSAAISQFIGLIRRHSSATILLISPPDLYMPPKRKVKQVIRLANGTKKTVQRNIKLKVSCDAALPPSYETMQRTLRAVAAKEKTLYWDWQAAMGGRCSMRSAAQTNPALAQPDGVHMTAPGYVSYARLLWEDVLKFSMLLQ